MGSDSRVLLLALVILHLILVGSVLWAPILDTPNWYAFGVQIRDPY